MTKEQPTLSPPEKVPPNQAFELDQGEEHVRFRKKWWQLWIPKDPPPPPPKSLDDAPVMPLAGANVLSTLTYTWVTPLMKLGFQRTLQAPDLWAIDSSRSASVLSTQLDHHWQERVQAAAAWNQKLKASQIQPPLYVKAAWYLRSITAGRGFRACLLTYENNWRCKSGSRGASLVYTLNDTMGHFFWTGGMIKVIGDVSQLMGPLLVKAIINFTKERAALSARGEPAPNVGRGIAMAVGLFLLIILTSLMQHQFFWRSMITGVLARTALISSIYKRGVRLTGKSRLGLPNSKIINHISTDVSRIDAASQWFHAAWTAPIQVVICLIILLVQLGPSALVGFALFLFMAPISSQIAAHQFVIRRQSMKFTDQRSKTLLEVLGGMRIVKYFSYEIPFLHRLNHIRDSELQGVRKISHSQSASVAFAYSTPVLAATLSLLVYTKLYPDFDVATVFASLSLFQLLRQPMMLLPRALSAITDSRNAFHRLTEIFEAELMPEKTFIIDKDLEDALVVQDTTFEWEESLGGGQSGQPFQVQNVSMRVKRGNLIGIIGRVGSGKSSMLQGLVGEMRLVSGKVTFGGEIAYCPQVAWIQNATLRDNILFGRPFNEENYWKIIDDACLLPDLKLLADGDLTEIGEKGINLSGGQKQRINIARALYSDADVLIFDDPLSAVDAHVGRSLFHNALLDAVRTRGKTVILVTHALHFVSFCDEIYMMENGVIKEHGQYQELISKEGEIARIIAEFGGTTEADSDSARSSYTIQGDLIEREKQRSLSYAAGTGKLEGRLIVKEKRTTGSVPGAVYWQYLSAGHGFWTMPILLLSIFLMQGSQIMNSYTLVWWQANSLNRPFSFYQGLYAGLGISQAIFTFALGIVMDTVSWFVSRNLHREAVKHIFYAPMSFFDTTPVGRIMGVFGKDIDSIDNQLPISMRLLALTCSSVLGAVIIITVVEHYFIIVVVVVSLGYQRFQSYYRASAREIKRLDAMLRSLLYAHFSESLSGLPTIRSYGEIPRFIRENEYYIDLENRALFITVTNQRWLAIRLDFCGAIMVFAIAVFAVVGTSSISPAEVGLVLTYTSTLTQLCGLLTRQTADVENYLNSVERVVHYSRPDMIEQEAPHEIPEKKPSSDWPREGCIDFEHVAMSYRPGLPNVLHDLSLSIKGGEKIGVVGRTGAGKSSLALTLLRIVEFSGLIKIDGVDISQIGLRDLRMNVSIIPQDPLLFSGTIRTVLDPFNMYDDAHLWDSLRRSSFLDSSATNDSTGIMNQNSYTLDSVIESEGANLSVGERSLLSLARALVRDSKVVILDEATASVDLETDKKIQQTIATEFKDRTLVCIAHRLRTILSYDRILVLDAGRVAEFDSPANLFQSERGIFKSFCDRSNITLQDIQNASSY